MIKKILALAFLVCLLSFTTADDNAPTATIVHPNGGEFASGNSYSIQFTVLDSDSNELHAKFGYTLTSKPSDEFDNVIVADLNLDNFVSISGLDCGSNDWTSQRTCTYTWNITVVADGNYYFDLNVFEWDRIANVRGRLGSKVRSASNFFVDNRVPTINVLRPASSTTVYNNGLVFDVNDAFGINNNSISVKVGGSAAALAGSGCTKIGDVNYHCDYNVNSIDRSATYNITIDASDSAGNAATQASISSLTYNDIVSPGQVSLGTPTTGSNSVTLTWTFTEIFDLNKYHVYRGTYTGFDTNSQTKIALVNAGTKTYNDTGVTNGNTYYYKVSANDYSNNEGSDSSEQTATPQDTSAPTGSITVADYTSDSTPTLTLSASTGTTQMKFSCDGNNWASAASYPSSNAFDAFNINSGSNGCSVGNGSKTIFAQFTKGGAWSSSYSDSTIFDTNAPAVSISSPEDGATLSSKNIEVSFSGSDNVGSIIGSGIAEYYYSYDSEAWRSAGTSTTATIYNLADGSHTIRVKARDNVDLNSAIASVTITVSTGGSVGTGGDTAGPTVSWVSAWDGADITGRIITLEVSATDISGVSWVKFYADENLLGEGDKNASNYSIELDANTLRNGNIEVKAVARDNSGNETESTIFVNVGGEGGESIAERKARNVELKQTQAVELFEKLKAANISLIEETAELVSSAGILFFEAKNLIKQGEEASALEKLENAESKYDLFLASVDLNVLGKAVSAIEAENFSSAVESTGIGLQGNEMTETVNFMKDANIERTLSIIEFDENGVKSFQANVAIKFKNNSGTSKQLEVFEFVPKEFAENAGMLKSNFEFAIIKADPVVKWSLTLNSGESKEIVYSLSGLSKEQALALISENIIEKFAGPPVITMSGFKTALEGIQLPLEWIVGAVLSIAVIVIIFAYLFYLRGKPKTKSEEESKLPKSSEKEIEEKKVQIEEKQKEKIQVLKQQAEEKEKQETKRKEKEDFWGPSID